MTRKNRKTAHLAAMFAVLLCGPLAHAQPFGPPPGGPGGGLHLGIPLDRLNLTDDQRTKIATITDSYSDQLKEKMDAMHTAHTAVRTAVQADPYDETAVRAAAKTLASAEEEMFVLHGTIFSQVRPLLTAEQLSELDSEPSGGPGGGRFGRFNRFK